MKEELIIREQSLPVRDLPSSHSAQEDLGRRLTLGMRYDELTISRMFPCGCIEIPYHDRLGPRINR